MIEVVNSRRGVVHQGCGSVGEGESTVRPAESSLGVGEMMVIGMENLSAPKRG